MKSKEGRNALFIMQATDVGQDVMNVVHNAEGTKKQRDVYFITAAINSANGKPNTRLQGYSTQFSSNNINENGKLIQNKYVKNERLDPLNELDFSASKEKGNLISIGFNSPRLASRNENIFR